MPHQNKLGASMESDNCWWIRNRAGKLTDAEMKLFQSSSFVMEPRERQSIKIRFNLFKVQP